ncbi:hypothetical protein Slin15195_G057500 [Septoria linicola]|uniref:Uncharacterized protein n=1 Tax=Septoria linicola TaxID=215465 RepID=A0A9Q9AV41_9PEZI|nr:hypothetical protein Slin14017_G073350 [Septoria linicola]USW52431.1 hypothetical protein Slin15195_G057500 [Septoria linicola]
MIDMRDVMDTTTRLETVVILDRILHKRLKRLEERIEEIQLSPTLLRQVLITLGQIFNSLTEMRLPLQLGEQLLAIPHLDRERMYLKNYLRAARAKVAELSEDTTELELLCEDMCREGEGLRKPAEKSKM